MSKPLKIVFTGAESTGKSTLSKQMTNHYGGKWIPEIARSYIEKLNRKYNYEDVCKIAKQQISTEKNVHPTEEIVFFDTWLIITKVWFDFVYQKHPKWMEDAIKKSSIDLFLVCDTDLPWEYDPVRENGGDNRNKLQNIYIQELKKYGFNYQIIRGDKIERFNSALDAINKLKQKK